MTGILEEFTGILILITVFQSLLATDIEAARAEIPKISTLLTFYSIFRYIELISKK